MRSIMVPFLAIVVIALFGAPAGAEPILAYEVPAGTVGNGAGAFGALPLGMDFDVLSDVVVTDLGAFDGSGDGIAGTITVYIFDRSLVVGAPSLASLTGPELMASMTFTGTEGTLTGGHRFKPLAAEVTLLAGSYIVVAWPYGSPELWGEKIPGRATNDGGGLLSFSGPNKWGFPGDYPTIPWGISGIFSPPDPDPYRTAAGSFIYRDATAVPEPAMGLLFAQGGLVLLFALRRRLSVQGALRSSER